MSSEDDSDYPVSRRDLTVGLGAVAAGLGLNTILDLGQTAAMLSGQKERSGQAAIEEPEITIRSPENGQEFEEGSDVDYIIDVLTAQEPGEVTINSDGYERKEDVGTQTDREFRGEITGLGPGNYDLQATFEYGDRRTGETVSFEINPSENNDAAEEDFSYTVGDLPYDSIADGLAYQSDSAIDAFDDEIVEAFFNRNERSGEVVDDAYIEVEDATTREYLEASSDERENIDVSLGFENGSEGLRMRGSASAGMNEDFEEYMVGLDHLGRFDNEMEEYMTEIEDMLD